MTVYTVVYLECPECGDAIWAFSFKEAEFKLYVHLMVAHRYDSEKAKRVAREIRERAELGVP